MIGDSIKEQHCWCTISFIIIYYIMGRYSTVQSYADNSSDMRTIPYDQAVGSREINDTADKSAIKPNSNDNDTKQQQTSSQPKSNDEQQTKSLSIESANLKSDTTESTQQNQQRQQHTNSRNSKAASECNTNCLFVGGLHSRIQEVHLSKLFSPYGEVVSIKIVTNNPYGSGKLTTTESKGYAFVEYTTVEEARLAISRLDNRQLLGRTLTIRPSRRKMNELSRSGETKLTAAEAKMAASSVESKIEAVKRAIEEKKKGI